MHTARTKPAARVALHVASATAVGALAALAAVAYADSRPAAPTPASTAPATAAVATTAPAVATTAPAATVVATRASRTPAAPTTEADVRAFMHALASAAKDRDVARIGAALADDCAIELVSRIDGRERTTTFTRAEYLAMLDRGYLGMRDLEAYDYEIVDLRVALEPNGGATVHSRVRETVVLGGRRQTTHSEEVTRLVSRAGRLIAVAVTATTAAAAAD